MIDFAKPGVAIGFGAFMLCAETCLHADTLLQATTQPLELPLYDWMAGGLLLAAGIVSSREWSITRRQYQAAAWAFMLSLLTGALIDSWSGWLSPPTEAPEWGITEGGFVAIISLMTIVAVAALVSTLRRGE